MFHCSSGSYTSEVAFTWLAMLVCTNGLKLSVNGETGADSMLSVFELFVALDGLGELPQALAVSASAISAAAPAAARGKCDFRFICLHSVVSSRPWPTDLGKTV